MFVVVPATGLPGHLLLKLSEGKSVLLEEYAREMIVGEELHLDEVNKMLRKSGDVQAFKS